MGKRNAPRISFGVSVSQSKFYPVYNKLNIIFERFPKSSKFQWEKHWLGKIFEAYHLKEACDWATRKPKHRENKSGQCQSHWLRGSSHQGLTHPRAHPPQGSSCRPKFCFLFTHEGARILFRQLTWIIPGMTEGTHLPHIRNIPFPMWQTPPFRVVLNVTLPADGPDSPPWTQVCLWPPSKHTYEALDARIAQGPRPSFELRVDTTGTDDIAPVKSFAPRISSGLWPKSITLPRPSVSQVPHLQNGNNWRIHLIEDVAGNRVWVNYFEEGLGYSKHYS